jgi:hypothetical protein
VEVSLIIGPIVLVESAVGGGVVLLAVLSEPVALSLLFPQALKIPAIAMSNNLFFIGLVFNCALDQVSSVYSIPYVNTVIH